MFMRLSRLLVFLLLFLPGVALGSSLEDEISGDPLGRGYSSMTDTELLTSLNTKNLTRNRTSMTGREVRKQIDRTEYTALSAAKKSQLLNLVKSDDLDPFGLPADIIKDIFGSGSKTVSNLIAARVESISRSEEIGWRDVTMRNLRMHTTSRDGTQ